MLRARRRFLALSLTLLTLGPIAAHAAGPLDPQRGTLLSRLRLQVALDRAGFSPGLLDGRIGRKTQLAMQTLATSRGTRQAAMPADVIPDSLEPTARYILTARDVAEVGPCPTDWLKRAQLDRLRYPSLTELLAERGHCTVALLHELNPGRDLVRLQPGDAVTLPNVLDEPRGESRAASVVVNLDEKTVTALDRSGRPIALMHCSIARFVEKRPTGSTVVKCVALDPNYTFDPAMWPEVRNVDRKLTIPPGPRNPVGLAWIGLGLPGYGIHGTPRPELIGKTGSHGCIRLTNWDAVRLAHLVRPGTPVNFTAATPQVASR